MKAFYAIISVLNLQFTLLIAVVGGVLFFTGVLKEYVIVKIIWLILLGFSVLYAILTTLAKIFGLDKVQKKKRGRVQASSTQSQQPTEEKNVGVVDDNKNTNECVEETPRYYRVKQNPNMVMAEYNDRYELYDVSNGMMVKIRTDYK